MKTRAKFSVQEVTKFMGSLTRKNAEGKYIYETGECERIKFSVVGGNTPENETFAMYSPYGIMEMVVNNPAIIGEFKLGKEYYFDISPAE